jgi:cell shape-determining protein MreC
MAMQFSNKRKKKSPSLFVYGVIIFIIALFIILRAFFHPLFVLVSKPFVMFGAYIHKQAPRATSVGLSKQDLLSEINKLKSENELLVLTNNELLSQQALLSEFESSFGENREALNLQFAHVVSKPNQSVYDTILLSSGSDDGLAVGQSVFVNEFSLIGIIDHVEKNTAVALLFSSPGHKTFARLERTGYDVTVVGRGGGNMIVEVPKEVETALGDRLVYPALDNKVIGIIRDITLDDRDANKKLYITLPTNILTLDHIYIQK